MRVKLQLGQQIAQRDAQKGSRRKGQNVAQRGASFSLAQESHVKDDRPQRDRQRKQPVHQVSRKQRPTALETPCEYVGFDIPDEFVVGYGLDYDDKFRNLPYLAALEPDDLSAESA